VKLSQLKIQFEIRHYWDLRGGTEPYFAMFIGAVGPMRRGSRRIFRNPLADPEIIGVSISGAGLGAEIALSFYQPRSV